MLRRIFLILAYLGAVILLVGGTITLVAFANGLSYNFKTHQVGHSGLLILASAPTNAEIWIDGKDTRHRTPYRATMKTGQYDVRLVKSGYGDWQETLTIKASVVTFAEYPIMLPQSVSNEQLTKGSSIGSFTISPDHHMAAYVTTGIDIGVWLYNLDNRSVTKLFTPAVATADQPVEVLSQLAWSPDSSHLLIRSSIGAKTYYNLVNTSGTPAVTNLTNLFQFDFADMQFNPSNWKEIYWNSPEGLRKLDVAAQTVSAVLAPNTVSYTLTPDRVIYVQSTNLGKSVWGLDRGGHKQELIQSLPESSKYDLIYDNFHGRDILVVTPTATRTVTVYFDVFSPTPASKVITKSADKALVSSDGRNVVYYDSSRYGSYDIQDDAIAESPAFGKSVQGLTLFDNFHTLIVSDGWLELGQDDGANIERVVDQVTSLAAPTSDGRHVVELRQTAAGNQLFLTEIKR